MAQFYDNLNEKLQAFIAEQHIFFVATAPVNGRINLSPRGMDSFRCLDSQRVAFINMTGSGNETAAHLAQNGRLTIMFCSFDEKPQILRLYGQGRSIHRRDAAWAELAPLFPEAFYHRNIIVMDVESVQTSCGFAVPYYTYEGDRDLLIKWSESRGQNGLETYWEEKNQTSIDGLPTRLLAD
jgi:hypothetical protein